MTRRETPFATHRDLIFVRGRIAGPLGTTTACFVLDTGATYTTITSEVADDLGYSERDRLRRTRVHTAIGNEQGYVIAVAKPSVLGVAARSLPVHVFDLGYDDVDGLVGLNFLSLLNYETLLCSGYHAALHAGRLTMQGQAPYKLQFCWTNPSAACGRARSSKRASS